MVVEAQSPGPAVEEGVPFQGEEVEEVGPYPAGEEVGVEVQNQEEEGVEEVQNLVVEEEEGEAEVDKVQTQVRAGEVVGEEERHPLVKVVGVVVEVGEFDGHCSVVSAGTCRQSSL